MEVQLWVDIYLIGHFNAENNHNLVLLNEYLYFVLHFTLIYVTYTISPVVSVCSPINEIPSTVVGPLCFFLCFRWARALDLGRALPKKTFVFFCSARALHCCRFPKKTQLILRYKKHFEKTSLFQEIKNIFPAMFLFCLFFRRPH